MRELNEVEQHWESYLKKKQEFLQIEWWGCFLEDYRSLKDVREPKVMEVYNKLLQHVHLLFFKKIFYEFMILEGYPLKETHEPDTKLKTKWVYDEDDDSYDVIDNIIPEESFDSIVNHYFAYPLFSKYVVIDYDPDEEFWRSRNYR